MPSATERRALAGGHPEFPVPLIHCNSAMLRLVALTASVLAVAGLSANDLREAAESLQRNDFEGAVPHLRAALAEDPGNINARFNLAYALQATGDADGAIAQYALISEQQPHLIEARQNLATLLMQAERFAEAAEEYRAIAGAKPGDPSAGMLAAVALERSGQPSVAAEAYRSVLAAEPGSLDARHGLARSLDASGAVMEAVQEYLRLADSLPQAETALLDIAGRLEDSGRTAAALDLYRRHADRRPDDPAVHERLGLMLLEGAAPDEAARALERSVELEPTALRHSALAEAYRLSGDAAAAHEQLRMAADASPEDASARLRHASSLLQLQEFESSAREFLAAAEADPGLAEAWNGLAFAMYRLDNFAAALRALSESAKLGPAPPASVYLKAICQDNLQLYEEAQGSYRAFLEMEPEMEDETWKASQRLRTIEKILRKR